LATLANPQLARLAGDSLATRAARTQPSFPDGGFPLRGVLAIIATALRLVAVNTLRCLTLEEFILLRSSFALSLLLSCRLISNAAVLV
jgi:hypothetical protein